jgi:hypothetical protein
MKRIIWNIILVIVFISITYNSYGEYNLKKAENISFKINDKEYEFLLYKYDPPYIPRIPYKNRESANISTPENTYIAIRSAAGRDVEWYLSLFDEEARKNELKTNEETRGEWLKETLKGKPLPKEFTEEKSYQKFIYKMLVNVNKKEYAVIQAKMVWTALNQEYVNFETYVKKGDIWLSTNELDNTPFTWLASLKNYDEILQLSKKGYWYTPDFKKPPALKVTVTPSQKVYKYKEPLIFNVKVENIWKNEPVIIFNGLYPLGRTVRLKIQNQENNIYYESLSREENPTKKDFVTMKPGECKEATYRVTEYLLSESYSSGFPAEYTVDKDGNVYFPAGKYSVQGLYAIDSSVKDNSVSPKDLIIGFWESEPIDIEILPPDPQNEQPKQTSLLGKKIKIYLKDGETTRGKVIEENENSLKLRRDFATNYVYIPVSKEDIERIEEME